jgi:high-affinity Fe2+/Pb2+ permease
MPCDCEKINTFMHAIILILLIYVIWKLHLFERMNSQGSYIGHGLQDQVYTSGADLRDLGQVFTSTDQGRNSQL